MIFTHIEVSGGQEKPPIHNYRLETKCIKNYYIVMFN